MSFYGESRNIEGKLMFKKIFKNYDQFLENIRNKSIIFFKSKEQHTPSLQLKPIDIINLEIKRQEANLKQKQGSEKKLFILKKLLHLYLKKKALKSTSRYINRASDILKDETEDGAYEALEYLNRVPKNLSSRELNDIYTFKALIYELIEDYDEASNAYKEAIKYDKTPNTLKEFKAFVERSREAIMWQEHLNSRDLIYNKSNIHNLVKAQDMPKVAKRLETIAKYYARSPKSRALAKKYFKEVLKMYKTLSKNEPDEYLCIYINALLDAVEIFMMPITLLKEAQDLLINSKECNSSKIYLLERIKELKHKTFIKKSLIQSD